MNSEIKRLWVEALRSDRFVQGKGHLKQRNQENPEIIEHCCLGVLCELYMQQDDHGLNEWREQSVHDEHGNPLSSFGLGISSAYCNDISLPHFVQQWAQLYSSDPAVQLNGAAYKLSNLNDGYSAPKQYTFREIADLIDHDL